MAVTTRIHPNEDVQEFRMNSTGTPTPDTPAWPSVDDSEGCHSPGSDGSWVDVDAGDAENPRLPSYGNESPRNDPYRQSLGHVPRISL